MFHVYLVDIAGYTYMGGKRTRIVLAEFNLFVLGYMVYSITRKSSSK